MPGVHGPDCPPRSKRRLFAVLPDGWQRTDLPETVGRCTCPNRTTRRPAWRSTGRTLGTRWQRATCRRSARLPGRPAPVARLPVEQQEDATIGELLTLEARLTYRQDETTRKRWVRLLYQGRTQIRLVAEGSSGGAVRLLGVDVRDGVPVRSASGTGGPRRRGGVGRDPVRKRTPTSCPGRSNLLDRGHPAAPVGLPYPGRSDGPRSQEVTVRWPSAAGRGRCSDRCPAGRRRPGRARRRRLRRGRGRRTVQVA